MHVIVAFTWPSLKSRQMIEINVCKYFSFSAFSTDPESAVLGIGESIQIDVQFNAMKTGGHTSDMVIQYETGKGNVLLFLLPSFDLLQNV